MSYIVTRETTGKVGRYKYDHTILYSKAFDDYEAAIGALTMRKKALLKPSSGGSVYGNDCEFFFVRKDDKYDCVDRWYVENEYEDNGVTTFSLNKVEDERLHRFVEEHRKHGKSGAAGEFVRVYFCPTLLGTLSHAQCLVCGADENLPILILGNLGLFQNNGDSGPDAISAIETGVMNIFISIGSPVCKRLDRNDFLANGLVLSNEIYGLCFDKFVILVEIEAIVYAHQVVNDFRGSVLDVGYDRIAGGHDQMRPLPLWNREIHLMCGGKTVLFDINIKKMTANSFDVRNRLVKEPSILHAPMETVWLCPEGVGISHDLITIYIADD